MGNILITIAFLCVGWSISLFVLLFKSQVMDSKKLKNIILVIAIAALMLVNSAYLLNIGEDLHDIIIERKSITYQMDQVDIKEYKTNENKYVNNGLQVITIIGLLFVSGLEIIWITKAQIKQKSLHSESRWDLKKLSNSINNMKKAI